MAAATPVTKAPDPDDGGVGPRTPGRYSIQPPKYSEVGVPPHANVDLFWFVISHLMLLLSSGSCCCSRPYPKVVITYTVSGGYLCRFEFMSGGN